MSRRSALLIVAVLAFAGCGDDEKAGTATTADAGSDGDDAGDDDNQDRDALRDEYVAALVATASAEEMDVFGEGTAECLAPGFVDAVGVEQFVELGLTPDDIREAGPDVDVLEGIEPTTEMAEGIADVMFECIDFGDLFAQAVAGQPEGALVTDAQWDCVNESMASNDEFRAGLVESMLADESDNVEDPFDGPLLIEILEGCDISPELLG